MDDVYYKLGFPARSPALHFQVRGLANQNAKALQSQTLYPPDTRARKAAMRSIICSKDGYHQVSRFVEENTGVPDVGVGG